ncbi:hypothetical protein FHT40_004852 [Mycolicibacterium sp. BK556]|uniref:DUF2505 domain-containing protein n=1 Tax=Mycobacteriaceae TaxID=1762 RepID=UPI00106033BC|nr:MULTISPECIES: DUF2505 domain-containing protein [Mycobacteriaceae]MBB3605168.1 hypothetical protein [Mycolicibacterium sp. BK556]MBB3635364.1 hypothetical protein [Mycolicibacterium sp. BK607]MBB3747842.1 hypothetical protein [Mycolicibacterium sp. BK634]TDO08023.1 uncharacterized protein DUF2505 [Mycobacterium sp. BK086]
MSRRMDYVIGLDKPVADLYQSFTSRTYWEDLVAEHQQHTDTELTRFHSDDNGTDIVFTHTVSRRDVPSMIAAVVPLRLTITREQHFDPFDAATNSADGHYRALVPAAPMNFDGTYVLTQTGAGSQLQLHSQCKVNVPLVGGKIEKWVLDGLRGMFDSERDFTRDWIASHY